VKERELVAAGGAHELLHRLDLDQRHVAVEDERRAGVVEQRRRLLQGVAGAELRLLAHEGEARAAVACSTSAAPWPVTTIVRAAPRPAAASRTCCNKWRPARRCSTFGRAERIRVPLPAAMITTFNTMRLPVPRRRSRLPIIAMMLAATLLLSGCGMALRLGYNQGASLAFPLARRLRRVR
jgi:hypothetical protein